MVSINHYRFYAGQHGDYQGELQAAGAERIFYVADAMRSGMSVDDVFALTNIDPWFLVQLEDLVLTENAVAKRTLADFSARELYQLKRKGFGDARLAKLLNVSEKSSVKPARPPVFARFISVSIPVPPSLPRTPPICTPPTKRSARRMFLTVRRSWCWVVVQPDRPGYRV